MIQPTIRVDENIIRDIQAQLGEYENKAPRVIANALNRTMSNMATNINKEVRSRYNIKAADVKETLVKKRATPSDLSAGVKSKGGVIGLEHFKVMPKKVQPKRKSPIKTAVKKESPKKLHDAFVADVTGLKVFVRNSAKRLPIRRLYGPSIPQMLKNNVVQHEIQAKAEDMFRQRLTHEISRLVGVNE